MNGYNAPGKSVDSSVGDYEGELTQPSVAGLHRGYEDLIGALEDSALPPLGVCGNSQI